MKCKIVGYEHMAGKSKKDGRPYDLDVLHAVVLDKPRFQMAGNKVATLKIDRSEGVLTQIPQPGETYDIFFDDRGYPAYAKLIK